MIKAYAPDLTFLEIGANDAYQSVTAGAFSPLLTTLISAAQVSGDVVLVTMPPVSGSAMTLNGLATIYSFETTYQPVYAAQGLLVVDLWNRYGTTWQSSFMSGTVHPNDLGYWDMAYAVNALLNKAK